MSEKKEPRAHTRSPAYIVAQYRVKEGVFRDIIKNIGANGIFIATRRQIASEQPVEILFPLFTFEHNIQITGKVARSGPHGFAITFDQPIAGLICQEAPFPEIVHEIDRPNEPLP
jgi:hypothetical protein